MRHFARLIATCCLAQLMTASPVSAQQDQDPGKVGFIRLINLATAGEGNLIFKLDGSILYKPGYKTGQMTGGMGYQEGKMSLVAEKNGCRPAKREIDIIAGKTTTYVTYTAPVRDKEGRIIDWQVKITSLRQASPEKGFAITLVSLCPEKELAVVISAQGKTNRISAKVPSHRTKLVNLGRAQGDVRIDLAGKPLVGFSTDDPGNYVVMIYDDMQGNKKAIQYYDPKYLVAG